MSKFKFELWGVKIDLAFIQNVLLLTGAGLSTFYLMNQILGEMEGGRNKDSIKNSNKVLKKLRSKDPSLQNLQFDEYEKRILNALVLPEDLDVSFEDVGGLQLIIEELHEAVILPLTEPDLFAAYLSLVQSPKGVLFYGPPGCGKTMLAKAIAKESGAYFLLIKMLTIMNMWYGESNKIANAIFSLANKLQPCIIFIDEIDSFLRERSSSEHEVSAMLKAEFMTLWDGLSSNGRIMVMGATNRQNDIDQAFMRRMPKRFAVGKPDMEQRKAILTKILRKAELDDTFDLDVVVRRTEGFSGSELRELCREAALNSMKQYIRSNYKNRKKVNSEMDIKDVRPLGLSDFFPDDPVLD